MRPRAAAVLAMALLCAVAPWLEAKPPERKMRYPGFESRSYWKVQPSNYGTIKSVTGKDNVHSGKSAVRLDIRPKAKKHSITLYGYHRNTESAYPGETYVFGFWMKGKGKATLSLYEYGVKKEEGKEPRIGWIGRTDLPKPVQLTEKWQEMKREYRPEKGNIVYVAPTVRLEGKGAWALVDDASFAQRPSPLSLDVQLHQKIVCPGESIPYQVTVKGGKATKLQVLLYDPRDDVVTKAEAAVDAKGVAKGTLALPKDAMEGIYVIRFSVAGTGPGTSRSIEVMSKALRDQVAALAKKVKFKKPEKLMFVGDSLTDMFRGRNYVDKIDLYLRMGTPGQFEVINAGIGGDMINRVAARLERDVLAPKPTHVFIFLGHNDSKVASPEYKKHACEVDVFEPTYREVIKKIKDKTGAKVTVMSASSSVWEICWATAQKRAKQAAEAKKAGKKARGHNLFGKPSELELYNKLAKKVGDEFGCDYIDLYTPLKDIPEKTTYFTPDGVHVSEKGNRFIAIELLKYLAQRSK